MSEQRDESQDDEESGPSVRPKWLPFSRPREISAFVFGIGVAILVVITGRTEIAVLFGLIILGAKADDIHLPRVQREPVYALVGYLAGYAVTHLNVEGQAPIVQALFELV